MSVPTKTNRPEQFVLRLPDGMRERISDAAKFNRRSMNSEIIVRLEKSLRASGKQPSHE